MCNRNYEISTESGNDTNTCYYNQNTMYPYELYITDILTLKKCILVQ